MFDQVGIRREQQPKIVAITCLIEKEFVNKAYKSGIDKIIPKPLPIEQFGQLLKNMNLIDEIPKMVRGLF